MPDPIRIYLDNAATSWPKPDSVYDAVQHAMRQLGAPAGRGVYREANDVERLMANARRAVANLIAADEPNRIVFTFNGTDSLNLALCGVLRPGDHVVTSVSEHNSVLRPLRHLESHGDIAVTRVGCNSIGFIDPDQVRTAIRPETRLIALSHASNVTGAIQPIEQVGRIAQEHGVLFLLDAAQTLGHVPVNVQDVNIDLLAAPGHKGLLGPLGTGILYFKESVAHQLLPQRRGGTGTHSDEDRQPDSLPDKFESGNHNVPGIAGLGAGVKFLGERGIAEVQRHRQRLTSRLIDGLRAIDSTTVYGPTDVAFHAGVVSLNISGFAPQEVATMLDTSYSIQVRSGIHCAPRMHEALGTLATGGTIRISPGVFTTELEIETAILAVAEIAAAAIHA